MSRQRIIGVSEAHFGQAEKDALCRVIDSGWISMGDEVARLERAFAQAHDHEEGVAVSSCTAGLHLSLEALGIGEGDEVLVPGLTFVATVNAVLYARAVPVPVDIVSLQTPHISLKAARRLITERTRAVIVMPYGGYALDMAAWAAFCKEHSLFLVTDAAHAAGLPGAAAYGDVTVFSFFANKNMTTAEGGMILSCRPDVLAACRSLRGHAMTTQTLQRNRGHAYSYDVTELGYNYRMDELRAALGMVQLDRLERANARRRELMAAYRSQLNRRLPDIQIPFTADHATAAHFMPVVLPQGADRAQIMVSMREAGVQTSIHYPPYHRFTWHSNLFAGVSLSQVDEYTERCLTLPLHVNMDEIDVDTVVAALATALRLEQPGAWSPARGTVDYHACLKEGFAALEKGETQQAREHFRRILDFSPHSDAARVGLVLAAQEQDAAGKTLAALWRVLETNPASVEAWDALARLQPDDPAFADVAQQCAAALRKDA